MILIDSHILLWLLQEPDKVGERAKSLLAHSSFYVSSATIWELGIKHSKGKLDFSSSELLVGAKELGGELLDILPQHIVKATTLKMNHTDPFDHMLVTQSIVENMSFLTCDAEILKTNNPSLRLIDGRL